METIKKYNNRKLYSTKLSKYVKLSYITDLVKDDQKFMVIDNTTGDDITIPVIKSSIAELPMSLGTMVQLIRGSQCMDY